MGTHPTDSLGILAFARRKKKLAAARPPPWLPEGPRAEMPPRADLGPRPNNFSLEKALGGPFLGCPPGAGLPARRAAWWREGASPL